MDDNQNPEILPTSQVPEEYRPYSCTELTNIQIEYARDYLNETEENKRKYLRRIRRFMKDELSLFSDFEDIFILAFLRAKKFDFEQSCLLLRKGIEFVKTNEDYLTRIDTDIMQRVIASKAIGFLPYRDAKGRALAMIIAERWDPYDLRAEDIIFGTLIAFHEYIENPVNQVTGIVVIADCKGVYFGQFQELISWAQFLSNALQYCSPVQIKEIHVLHTPSIILWSWSIVKPFLSEKAQKVITFYDSSNWESLYEKIPPCILPEEIGGQLGPLSNDRWARDIPLIKEKFSKLLHKIIDE